MTPPSGRCGPRADAPTARDGSPRERRRPLWMRTTSPTARDAAGTTVLLPSRRTRATGAEALRSVSSARSPRYPVTTSAPTIGNRPSSTRTPSRVSPTRMARIPATASRRTNGSMTAWKTIRQTGSGLNASSSLEPSAATRSAASSLLSPTDGSTPSCVATSAAAIECAAGRTGMATEVIAGAASRSRRSRCPGSRVPRYAPDHGPPSTLRRRYPQPLPRARGPWDTAAESGGLPTARGARRAMRRCRSP